MLLLCLNFLFRIPVSSQQLPESFNKLTLLFLGDIMGHSEQIWSAEDRGKHIYNYDTVFSFVKPLISEADFVIANFEVTLGAPPYSGYPVFVSPAAYAAACKNAGIDCLAQANNHSADRRSKGILKTINVLDSIGIIHTGTFCSTQEREKNYPLFIDRNGITMAILNYSYGTNGVEINEPVILNKLEKDIIEKDIRQAVIRKPDIIIIFLHWGNEFDSIPEKSQSELADFMFKNGADLVIGSHPHVLQKMVWNKNTDNGKGNLVVYSLGNFVSNMRKRRTDGGAIVRVEITKTASQVKITDADYYLTWVYTPIENYRKRFFVIPCSQYENREKFFSDSAAYQRMKRFIIDSRSLLYRQNVNMHEKIFNGSSWLLTN